jgi:hypothetical protein
MYHDPISPAEESTDLGEEVKCFEAMRGKSIDVFQDIMTASTAELQKSVDVDWKGYEVMSLTIVPTSSDSQSSSTGNQQVSSSLNTVLEEHGMSGFEVKEVQIGRKYPGEKSRYCAFYLTLSSRGIRFWWDCQ